MIFVKEGGFYARLETYSSILRRYGIYALTKWSKNFENKRPFSHPEQMAT